MLQLCFPEISILTPWLKRPDKGAQLALFFEEHVLDRHEALFQVLGRLMSQRPQRLKLQGGAGESLKDTVMKIAADTNPFLDSGLVAQSTHQYSLLEERLDAIGYDFGNCDIV
jgi:hypothetical protein